MTNNLYVLPSSNKDKAAKQLAEKLEATLLEFTVDVEKILKPLQDTDFVLDLCGVPRDELKNVKAKVVDTLDIVETNNYLKLPQTVEAYAETFKWIVENDSV